MNEIIDEFGSDPLALCREWLAEATKSEPNDPEAVNLATATPDGKPSNRWVLIKQIDTQGLRFHTNSESRKGQEIKANPFGAINFYWKSTRKQIRAEGPIVMIAPSETDEYFATRRIERQIGAWASRQSQPFQKWADMEAAVKKYEQEFADVDNIPRPPYWQGYRLQPRRMEFWIAHRDRLHKRFLYTLRDDGGWDATWLCP